MADILIHRGFHSLSTSYIYWQANAWDPTGISYTGPPPFGELSNISVIQFIPGAVAGAGTPTVEEVTLSGPGDTVHPLANTPLSNTLTVFLNGSRLIGGGVDYSLSGSTVTLSSGPLESGWKVSFEYEF